MFEAKNGTKENGTAGTEGKGKNVKEKKRK